jgi:hypothetical protein
MKPLRRDRPAFPTQNAGTQKARKGSRYKGDCKNKDKAWNLIPSSYSDRCRTYGALSISYRVSQPSRTGLISAAPPALRTKENGKSKGRM